MLAVYPSQSSHQVLNELLNTNKLPGDTKALQFTHPIANYDTFNFELPQKITNHEKGFIVIQFIIKSGSDDSFYYGNSNAIFEDLHFIVN